MVWEICSFNQKNNLEIDLKVTRVLSKTKFISNMKFRFILNINNWAGENNLSFSFNKKKIFYLFPNGNKIIKNDHATDWII